MNLVFVCAESQVNLSRNCMRQLRRKIRQFAMPIGNQSIMLIITRVGVAYNAVTVDSVSKYVRKK